MELTYVVFSIKIEYILPIKYYKHSYENKPENFGYRGSNVDFWTITTLKIDRNSISTEFSKKSISQVSI